MLKFDSKTKKFHGTIEHLTDGHRSYIMTLVKKGELIDHSELSDDELFDINEYVRQHGFLKFDRVNFDVDKFVKECGLQDE